MKIKTIFVLLFFAIAIIGIIAPINAASGSISGEDKVYTIESKKKAASIKITWNANGGKIGTKKTIVTAVKKGSNLNKLVVSPKRSGSTFKGWYTKKSGGTKITTNTKPSKSVTYFAQWKKKSSSTNRVLNADEKKLVGKWSHYFSGSTRWEFKKDGTFSRYSDYSYGFSIDKWQTRGYYSLNKGVLTIQAQSKYSNKRNPDWDLISWRKWETNKYNNVKFGTEDGKQYVILGTSGKHFKY